MNLVFELGVMARGISGNADEADDHPEVVLLRAAAARIEGFEAMRRTIESERMTWAMKCECYCPACKRLDTLLRTGSTRSGGAAE